MKEGENWTIALLWAQSTELRGAKRSWDGDGVLTIEISPPCGVPPGSPAGGENARSDILTKITRTGRKPSPGELEVIRHGNISGLRTASRLGLAIPHIPLLTHWAWYWLLAGWCDGVLLTNCHPLPHQAPQLHCLPQLSLYLWRNQGNNTAGRTNNLIGPPSSLLSLQVCRPHAAGTLTLTSYRIAKAICQFCQIPEIAWSFPIIKFLLIWHCWKLHGGWTKIL